MPTQQEKIKKTRKVIWKNSYCARLCGTSLQRLTENGDKTTITTIFSTNKKIMKAIKIDNQHGIGLILGRTTTTIIDCHGMRKGDDEIILYVPDASDYDTDFIQSDCAMLHFSPAQAKRLARKLLRLANQQKTSVKQA